jgi:4-hydroxy-3-methylbut-2-enyl diphosphate reductase
VAERYHVPAYLVDTAEDVDPAWLSGRHRVGVTAGASAPEPLVAELVERLKGLAETEIVPLEGVKENMAFPLPKGLWQKDVDAALAAKGRTE